MDYWNQAKQDAKALRAELRTTPSPATLLHSDFLDMVARTKGSADWNTYFARVQRRYFYDQHAPYLPNNADFVRAMSVRRAALVDLGDLETREGKAGKKESGPAFFAHAIERALRQARAAFQGQARVAPSLLRALESAATKTTVGFRNDEEFAHQAMNGAMLLSNSDSYSTYLTQPDLQAYAYSTTYLDWRLATLAAAWARCLFRPHSEPSLSQLVKDGEDPFQVAGEVLHPKDDAFATTAAHDKVRNHRRAIGKTVLLSLLANGSMEASLRFDGGVTLDNADSLGRKLLARFPEITFWHAWVELKPLLAEGIDNVKLPAEKVTPVFI